MINKNINIPRHNEVVLVINNEGKKEGEMSYSRATNLAYNQGLDLVPVGQSGNIPIYKICNKEKWEYEQKKIQKRKMQNQKKIDTKEFRFNIRIDTHDMKIKVSKIEKVLSKHNLVKIVIKLNGRERSQNDIAMNKLNEILSLINYPYKKQDVRVNSGEISLIICP